jgi:hypothetical protein
LTTHLSKDEYFTEYASDITRASSPSYFIHSLKVEDGKY